MLLNRYTKPTAENADNVFQVVPAHAYARTRTHARIRTHQPRTPADASASHRARCKASIGCAVGLLQHLTNYSINKNSDDFVPNESVDDADTGSKRSWLAVQEQATQPWAPG